MTDLDILDIFAHDIGTNIELKGKSLKYDLHTLPDASLATSLALVGAFGEAKYQPQILDSIDAVLNVLSDIASSKQEHFVMLALDKNRRLIAKHTVFIGTVNSTIVHPREVFAHALREYATSIIIAHNHPSGDTSPSDADIETTQQLVAAAQILGLRVADHIIISKCSYFSFQREGLIDSWGILEEYLKKA